MYSSDHFYFTMILKQNGTRCNIIDDTYSIYICIMPKHWCFVTGLYFRCHLMMGLIIYGPIACGPLMHEMKFASMKFISLKSISVKSVSFSLVVVLFVLCHSLRNLLNTDTTCIAVKPYLGMLSCLLVLVL